MCDSERAITHNVKGTLVSSTTSTANFGIVLDAGSAMCSASKAPTHFYVVHLSLRKVSKVSLNSKA
jgi:hypothetical protein